MSINITDRSKVVLMALLWEKNTHKIFRITLEIETSWRTFQKCANIRLL